MTGKIPSKEQTYRDFLDRHNSVYDSGEKVCSLARYFRDTAEADVSGHETWARDTSMNNFCKRFGVGVHYNSSTLNGGLPGVMDDFESAVKARISESGYSKVHKRYAKEMQNAKKILDNI